MPFKDPEMKRAYMQRWRKESIANGYGSWLYHRRALRFADAEHFHHALLEIKRMTKEPEVSECIAHALAESDERWRSLGPSPTRKMSHARKPDDTLLQALSKLGLPN